MRHEAIIRESEERFRRVFEEGPLGLGLVGRDDLDGVIKVTTSHIIGGPTRVSNNVTKASEGDYIRLEVSDTGAGMTEEVKAKTFDPFFSTKFAGRGLGLAVVQGIVRAHGGVIDLVSVPGQGTTFHVFFPVLPRVQDAIPSVGVERSKGDPEAKERNGAPPGQTLPDPLRSRSHFLQTAERRWRM
jgi:signal transduction histidine kinase